MSFPQILRHPTPRATPPDFVRGDLLALASHMQRCARARGAFFGLRTLLQTGRSALIGRTVTVGCVAATFGLLLALVVL